MRVLIESDVWHLDVDSDYPPGVGARKGMAVRRLKINASWVKYVVRQYGPYLLWESKVNKGWSPRTQGLGPTNLWCSCC